ncbi:MAG: phosphoribosylformylglycinamidine cyclo-ligase [Gemmatimonadetes bacterium RBG_16_66_8]|nr:MAG: phosphoribosylformylglycinamidine cyclo-ligase [Gemmatimonadetes bacterium RBG_16_66_8]
MTTDRYRAAGVDLTAAERVKQRIGAIVASARTPLARGRVGGFGGMVRLPDGVADPSLVLSTDGVGTKVLVAIQAGRHDTVGEDLVNHCVDDILVHGATPLAFLDYIAGSALEDETVLAVVEGVARGCRAHDMTLAGGETAQMADLYQPRHYDLAGTIVGVVSEGNALHGDRVALGDLLIGYASSGLHTNGYTLARRILFDDLGLDADAIIPQLGRAVGDVLLEVHRSYWRAIAPVLGHIHALAHVTGGGIPGNLSRSLKPGCQAAVERAAWPIPGLFRMLEEAGGVDEDEMYRVFNMGLGMIAIVAPSSEGRVREAAVRSGVDTWMVGEVVAGEGVLLR